MSFETFHRRLRLCNTFKLNMLFTHCLARSTFDFNSFICFINVYILCMLHAFALKACRFREVMQSFRFSLLLSIFQPFPCDFVKPLLFQYLIVQHVDQQRFTEPESNDRKVEA